MAFLVLTKSPVDRLVSLDALKTELGISGSAEDAKLGRLLNGSARAFAQYLGWPLPRQRYQQSLSGNGRQRLVLAARPLDADSVTLTIDDVAYTDFSVESPSEATLWRDCAWPACKVAPGQDGKANTVITFKAGWVLPEYLATWAANDATIANATAKWIRPSSPTSSPYLFEVTTAGTLGATEPTWPTTAGETVTSGAAILTARDAFALPDDLYEVALLTAIAWYEDALQLPSGIASEQVDGLRTDYDIVATREAVQALPPAARAVLESYR